MSAIRVEWSFIRILGALAGVALAVLWVLGAPSLFSQVVGGVMFAGVGFSVLFAGFWELNWVWVLAIVGVLMVLASPRSVIIGAILALPFVVMVVGRLWVGFQDWVYENSVEEKA